MKRNCLLCKFFIGVFLGHDTIHLLPICPTDMDNQSVKNNISRIRKDRRITKKEMAERLGLSRTAYHNIENGDTKLLSENISKVADAMNVPVEEVVLGYMPREYTAHELKEIQEDYDSRLAAKDREIEMLNDVILSLKDTLRTKDEIISMLRRRIPEENSV